MLYLNIWRTRSTVIISIVMHCFFFLSALEEESKNLHQVDEKRGGGSLWVGGRACLINAK